MDPKVQSPRSPAQPHLPGAFWALGWAFLRKYLSTPDRSHLPLLDSAFTFLRAGLLLERQDIPIFSVDDLFGDDPVASEDATGVTRQLAHRVQAARDQSRKLLIDTLAIALVIRFQAGGKLADLDEAVALCLESESLLDSDALWDRAACFNLIATCLLVRYSHCGDRSSLHDSIQNFRKAYDLLPSHASISYNTGCAHLVRFGTLGDIGDLRSALTLLQGRLSKLPSKEGDKESTAPNSTLR